MPPRSGDGAKVREAARGLVGYVDAVNVTDNPSASPHMSPLAGARFVHEAGAEPTLQLVCRDRNRLAITADLLGGWALGARNLLVLGGDPMDVGDHPDAKAVFDLGPNEVVALARRIRDEGTTGAGAEIADPPRYLIGVADVPLADPYDPAKLEAKLDAGGDVVWTQIVVRRRSARGVGGSRPAPRGLRARQGDRRPRSAAEPQERPVPGRALRRPRPAGRLRCPRSRRVTTRSERGSSSRSTWCNGSARSTGSPGCT